MVATPYVSQRFREIDLALVKASAWGQADPELSAYLAGYLVVVIAGVFEDCVEHLVCTRAGKAGDPYVETFIRSRVQQTFRNPNHKNVATLLADFGAVYKDEYKKQAEDEAIEALNSIVTNKNSLGHQGVFKSQVTVSDVEGYFRRSSQIFDVLEDVLR